MLESLSGKTCHAGTQHQQQWNITSFWRFNERSLDHIRSFNTCQRHYENLYFILHMRRSKISFFWEWDNCWRMKDLRSWLGGRQAALSVSWWKPCKVSEHRESTKPQLSHTDIHMEETTKKQLSSESRSGTDLSENTPAPGDGPQWLCEEARQHRIVLGLCASGPEFEWATWAKGQARMKTHCCMGQLGCSHATDIHQSGDDTLAHK